MKPHPPIVRPMPALLVIASLAVLPMTACQAPATRPPQVLAGEKLDPVAAKKDEKKPILWYDAQALPVEGKGWTQTEGFYDRLPAKAKGVVRDPVWNLSKSSAGLCVRFVTDSTRIEARWTVTSKTLAMDHMPATGMSGVDLYVRTEQGWRWLGIGRTRGSPDSEFSLANGIPAGLHEYRLYLPLYNGTKSLEIGIDPQASLAPPKPVEPAAKPILFYGTSITQGGCASRPGMAYPAIIGRHMDVPTINLGFSGNGKMEPELADLLVEIDAAAYVLDCLPNMTTAMVAERVVPFVRKLRAARPATPIILVENIRYQYTHFLPNAQKELNEKNRALREAYRQLADVRGLTYVPCDSLIGNDFEATVDGAHMTDLGFLRMSDSLEPILRKALSR